MSKFTFVQDMRENEVYVQLKAKVESGTLENNFEPMLDEIVTSEMSDTVRTLLGVIPMVIPSRSTMDDMYEVPFVFYLLKNKETGKLDNILFYIEDEIAEMFINLKETNFQMFKGARAYVKQSMNRGLKQQNVGLQTKGVTLCLKDKKYTINNGNNLIRVDEAIDKVVQFITDKK